MSALEHTREVVPSWVTATQEEVLDSPSLILTASAKDGTEFHVDMSLLAEDEKLSKEDLSNNYVEPAVHCLMGAIMEREYPGFMLKYPRRAMENALHGVGWTTEELAAIGRLKQLGGA